MVKLKQPLTGKWRISQRFGENPAFYRQFGLAGHEGADYACPVGTPVLACHAGRCDPRWGPTYGNYVRVYGDGMMTLYAHLLRTAIDANQEVAAGEALGLSGNSGRTTGPHLHLGLKVDGLDNARFKGWIDPGLWLEQEEDMGQKTSVHIERVQDWMPGTLAEWRPDWVKIVNPGVGCTDPFPEVANKNVRIHTDDWDNAYVERGEEGGRAYVQRLLPDWNSWPWATAKEVTNERECNSNPGIANLVNFSIGAMREASAHGHQVIILNWPEGNPHDNNTHDPSVAEWKVKQYIPAVLEAIRLGHIIGLHAYWRPEIGTAGPLDPHHALGRIEQDVAWWIEEGVPLDGLRVQVTEWGVDGGVGGHTKEEGWISMVAHGLLHFDEYMAQIAEGERRARQVAWLQALYIFDVGCWPRWRNYNHDRATIHSIIAALQAISQPPQPEPMPSDKLTVMELQNARRMWESFPMSKKHALELGWDHIDETRVFPGFVVYALRNPANGSIHVFKREIHTWQIVDEKTL